MMLIVPDNRIEGRRQQAVEEEINERIKMRINKHINVKNDAQKVSKINVEHRSKGRVEMFDKVSKEGIVPVRGVERPNPTLDQNLGKFPELLFLSK